MTDSLPNTLAALLGYAILWGCFLRFAAPLVFYGMLEAIREVASALHRLQASLRAIWQDRLIGPRQKTMGCACPCQKFSPPTPDWKDRAANDHE